jgi:hypothetical protein
VYGNNVLWSQWNNAMKDCRQYSAHGWLWNARPMKCQSPVGMFQWPKLPGWRGRGCALGIALVRYVSLSNTGESWLQRYNKICLGKLNLLISQIKFYLSHTHGEQMLVRV